MVGPPRYSLSEAQALASGCRPQTSVVKKAADFMCCGETEAIRHIARLIGTLTPGDFAEPWSARAADGSTICADVYGKVDDYGLWYIKFRIVESRLAVLSCHDAAGDIVLANRVRLRKG